MLASVAFLPAAAPHWWGENRNKLVVSVTISLPVVWVVLPVQPNLLMEALADYLSFIVLLAALYIIAGGIFIRGAFAGTPLVNTAYLAIGSLLANVIGTTGASILLIRPYLRANHHRRHRAHLIVFFIFLVSNIGGLLIPLGDPPLFLGYLRGIPFHWTLTLIPQWAFAVGAVLIVFNLYDQYVFGKEEIESAGTLIEEVQPRRPVHVEGELNFVYLVGVIVSAIFSNYFGWPRLLRDTAIAGMAVLSWFTTAKKIHHANHFDFQPFLEIAALFLGIFVTMVPVLAILYIRAASLNLIRPWQYFWLTGLLSSFLDSAPAYLTFGAMASGLTGGTVDNFSALLKTGIGQKLLAAISCGAVFMGAGTYIGNAPNFMVKAIAERHGVKTPSFMGYMIYSLVILLPIFILLTVVFFR
jgi:Na+/H+ antiporter NhaD/arsenite permease-like protein